MQSDAPISPIEYLPQLYGVWWRLGQLIWLALACFVVGLFLLSLPPSLERYSTICSGPDCLSFSLYPGTIEELAAIGFTPNLYAATIIGLDIAIFLIYFGLAAFIWYQTTRHNTICN